MPGQISPRKGTPSMFGTKVFLRMIPDGKANGMASEASHFYQTLGIRSQASLTSTLHAQV